MNYKTEVEIINELTDLSEIVEKPFPGNAKIPFQSYGLSKNNISFVGFDKISKFQAGVKGIYNSNGEVSDTWTLKKLQDEIVDLVRLLKSKNIKCSAEHISKLYGDLTNVKIQESEILYEFYGAKMEKASINFGDFTIYNFDLSIKDLIEKYPYLSNQELFFGGRRSNHFIGIKVKARENSKAIEIAKKYCEVFENVFSYMISDLKHVNSVGIFNYRGWISTDHIVCNNESMSLGFDNKITLPVDIEHNLFKDPLNGNDKIWNLITKKGTSEIERRILNSIEWIGKAIHELDLSKSLVQFVFAIEGMLQFNDKTMISPSIVSQMSDWLAFIIQDDLEERKKIAKYFKDIYQKRSAIAHGALKTIDIQDLHVASQLSRLMIISFLTIKPFCEMKTMQELNDHLINLKFK